MHTVGPRAAGKVEFLTASPEAPAGQQHRPSERTSLTLCVEESLQVLLIQKDVVKHTSVRNLTKSPDVLRSEFCPASGIGKMTTFPCTVMQSGRNAIRLWGGVWKRSFQTSFASEMTAAS